MTTARGDYLEEIEDISLEEGCNKFSLPDDLWEIGLCEETGNITAVSHPKHEELIRKKYRWISERTIELLNQKKLSIPVTQVEFDYSYEYGVGLHIRIDEPFINQEDVIKFIEDYCAETYNGSREPLCVDAEELGIQLLPGDTWITWIDGSCLDTVAMKIDLEEQ